MDKIVITFWQNNSQIVIFVGVFAVFIFTIISLHKINKFNRKIDAIVGQVENYLSVVLEDEEKSEESVMNLQENNDPNHGKLREKERELETQNRLISAVLQVSQQQQL